MSDKLDGCDSARQREKSDLKPALPSEFHLRHAIGVRSNQANPVYTVQCGIGGDIGVDSHMDTHCSKSGLK